jgi:hypothetical protein
VSLGKPLCISGSQRGILEPGTPAIPAAQEAETRGSQLKAGPAKLSETLFQRGNLNLRLANSLDNIPNPVKYVFLR